jgi:lipopolysaccharide transport system ATP-binding protein
MMKDDVILKVENLSKQYRLGLVGTGTISHDFNRFLARIRGKEDPYLKIGESNDRSTKGTSEYVWALKDINFEVKRGEILGIIGKNGAGKSTLLKILSKVTGPTTGAIKSKGRIASLLEVGTGFHPEMTGKENIFLNGAILGMTKKEIASKLDEIIEFSGCERYVETPVKRYSSGMKVRLAFAVAAFLEPDILIVDEVLAVGDAEFQKKAIGKMQDISSQGGRTVLFVSHDMGAIQNLCNKLLVLSNGEINFYGPVLEGINKYIFDNSSKQDFVNTKNGIRINNVSILQNNKPVSILNVFSKFSFILEFEFLESLPPFFTLEFIIRDVFGRQIATLSTYLDGIVFQPNSNRIIASAEVADGLPFKEGNYILEILLKDVKYYIFPKVLIFTLLNVKNKTNYNLQLGPEHGNLYIPHKFIFRNFDY